MATQILSDKLARNDAYSFVLQAKAVMEALCSSSDPKGDEYIGIQVLIEGVSSTFETSAVSESDQNHAKAMLSLCGACALLESYLASDASDDALNAVQTLLLLAQAKATQQWDAFRANQMQPA